MVLSISHASEVCWMEVCKKVKGAIVFIDDYSGECLHWHGGLLRLLESGATTVKQFSSFESGEDNKKAVFIVSSPLVGPARIILRDLISNSKFLHCVLITSCSPAVLTVATTGNVPESSNEMSALQKLEFDMLRWMKNQEAAAEIFHFPVSVVPVTDYFFATPPFSNFFPCFTEDLQGKTVYSQMMAVNKMSLLLIDRSLDLCGIMYGAKDILLDKMKSVLPAFPGHSVDVAIDISPVCYAKNEPNDFTFIAPGCLHEPPSNIFELLINKNVKNILLELYTRLAKASNINKIPQSVTVDELESLILKNFKKKYERIQACSDTIQACLGVIETLKSPKISSLEMAECSQKLLLQSVAAEGNTDEALKQLQNLVLDRKKRGFNIEIILTIITFFYSLIGQKFPINPQLEKDLEKVIADALLEDKEDLGMPKTLLENVTESNSKEFCKHIFTKLQYLKNARMHLTKYSDVASYEGPHQPLEYNGLITQLICDIVDVTKPEIPDLRYKANYGLKDNFASRFSKILNVSKPHVMDNEFIMVYIVGGITAKEVKFIKDCFKAYGKDVIIGSTALVSEIQILKNLFINDPLKPFVI
ncbi:sec1 family domain-containing protein 2-like isoform X2 [Rhodnius prolixus]|uniref:Sec1 family domain protein n=1 Tax=Rhodnius prolixus TaxID=13249 RepID=T1I8Q3_RHOPR